MVCLQSRRYLSLRDEFTHSNQKRAKIRVIGPHENYGGCSRPFSSDQRDGVTSLQVEHTACVQGTFSSSVMQRLSQGNDFVVDTDIDSSIVSVVYLGVDVVPTRGGHNQFAITILHSARKMAVGGADRPVFD